MARPARPPKTFEANKSFYQYILVMGGVAFGVAELSFLRTGDFSDARVIFGTLVSVGFLLYLLTKKKILESRREKLVPVALGKRYSHIGADYLCIVGVTALFSMLAYMVLNDVSFFRQGWGLTSFSFVVVLNFGLAFLGMLVLFTMAREERR